MISHDFSIVLSLLLSYCLAYSQGIAIGHDDTSTYMVGSWQPGRPLWQNESFPKNNVRNSEAFLWGVVDKYSPPKHFAMAPGINDTVQVVTSLINPSNTDYDLAGKSPQNWFKIQVFDQSSDPFKTLPYLDSSQVKYRFRRIGGVGSLNMKVHAESQDVSLLYDVWDLPIGNWQVVLRPSANLPNEVAGRTGGEMIVNFPAHNLMDSIAAYEGNFWRLWDDREFEKAHQWIDSIFKYNENSFVGWGLTLELAYSSQDSAGIVDASTQAIKILEQDLDPTVPHSDKLGPQENYTIERAWYEHYLEGLRSILSLWTN